MTTHPGEHLAEYLEMTTLTPSEAAANLGMSMEEFDALLAQQAPVTEDSARMLEKLFGLKAYIWLGIQRGWDEAKL